MISDVDLAASRLSSPHFTPRGQHACVARSAPARRATMTIGAIRPASAILAPAQFFARRELAVLLAASCFHPSPARASPDDGAEERLIALLSKGGVAGAKLRPVDVNEVDRLVAVDIYST